ncbi:hypothetical protein LEP1GSC108_1562 [Leptospira weilii str. UI 13098]|uniref:Uncharacterized protein n=1 Tax=Leptospira weilii str. UI 13098 TaxID=1088542 RepID=M6Q512_9LEPT|nr:hypothetical protein LEP1GSC108_1562 [Leptospira weilii str. UI 13098]
MKRFSKSPELSRAFSFFKFLTSEFKYKFWIFEESFLISPRAIRIFQLVRRRSMHIRMFWFCQKMK